jgi:AcrR family transcriptional regulator
MGETKNEIFKAALEIFSKYGYHSASMRQIAEHVGIKKASLYNHFPSKESILDEVLKYFRSSQPSLPPAGATIRFPSTATIGGILNAQIDTFIKRYSDPLLDCAWVIISEEQYTNKEACAIILETTELYLAFSRIAFEAMRVSGLLRKDIDPATLASAYAYGFRAMHLEYGLRLHHNLTVAEIVERMHRHADFFTLFAEKRN